MNPDCPDCKHPYSGHTADGCWHHDLGVICGCMILPPPETVETLQEQLRVQTERAERLDKENNARFSKETEYQNRIRMLEQKLRDVASYAARDLPQR